MNTPELSKKTPITESMPVESLIELALAAKEQAYVPFSHFHVGAALETADGRIYTGCNIENSSFGATNCAERTAIFKAVSDGVREVRQLAIVSDDENYCSPCGICRQVMAEFAAPGFLVHLARPDGEYKSYTMREILPEAFRLQENAIDCKKE